MGGGKYNQPYKRGVYPSHIQRRGPGVTGNPHAKAENLTPEQNHNRFLGLIKTWKIHSKDYKRREKGGKAYMKAEAKKIRNPRIVLRTTVAREAREIQEMARTHATKAMERMAEIVNDPNSPDNIAVAAAEVIFNRAYGKPNQLNTNLNVDANGKPKEVSGSSSISELRKLSLELRTLQDEREKRLRARNSLLTYASSIEIPTVQANQSIDEDEERDKFVPLVQKFGAHHLLWLDCLQKVEDGQIKRLLGLWPPGSAKSTYTSVVFPTHFLGRFPKRSIILTSYGSDLPKKFGRRARSIIEQPNFRRIFDCSLSEESAAADEWSLTNGSEWMASGILTGITGNRADGIVWDDLIKGREQADSELIRGKIWDAYTDDLLTRKKPNAFEVGIMTHWNEDDPVGRILPEDYDRESGWIKCRDGNDWYVVCLPAEAEKADDPLGRKIGERIWPEYFTDPDHFETFKRQPRTWSALFQQRPAPDTGDFFQGDWLKPWPGGKAPVREALHIYGASDYAVTDNRNDYTVHIVVGVDHASRIFLLDLWRQQASSDKWVESFCDLVAKWKPLGWAEEAGQIKSGVGPFLEKRLRERRLYIARAKFPTKGDKSVRAQSIRGRMAMDGLYCPFHEKWFSAFKGELMSFPAGRNDDQVDALGLIGQVLDKMVSGRKPVDTSIPPKIFSTNPADCTVTLTDMFEANERKRPVGSVRIH